VNKRRNRPGTAFGAECNCRAELQKGDAMPAVGTKLPILDVCCPVAIEGKADVARTPDFGSD
jgi:hypothetical protein